MSCKEDHREPLGSRSQPKRTSGELFQYLVTPDRIPEFIIPSLDILEEHRIWGKETNLEHEAARGRMNPYPKDERHSFGLDPLKMDAKACDIPDPVVRAALSLPHLPKITTPYGFVALGASPHVPKEEALFFQLSSASPGDRSPKRFSAPQVIHKERALVAHTGVNTKRPEDGSCGISVETRKQHELSFLDATAKENKGTPAKSAGTWETEFPLQEPKRNLFRKILKKHFARLWRLKAVRFPTH